jgi:hypothetical protein
MTTQTSFSLLVSASLSVEPEILTADFLVNSKTCNMIPSGAQPSRFKIFCGDLCEILLRESDWQRPFGVPNMPDIHLAHCGRSAALGSSSEDNVDENGSTTDRPVDLGVATVMRIREDGHAASQAAGLSNWQAWYAREATRNPEEWDMIELAAILSRVFFLDEFTSKLEFRWEKGLIKYADSLNSKPKPGAIIFGLTRRKLDVIEITVDPQEYHEHPGKKLESHHTALLSTFIHELIHAYFFAFCCDPSQAHSDRTCRRGSEVVWPKGKGDGHCIGWFLVACQIDLCIFPYLGFNGRVFAFRSLITYYNAGGEITAGDWELFFLLFNWDEVCELFGQLGERERWRLRDILSEDREVVGVFLAKSETKGRNDGM